RFYQAGGTLPDGAPIIGDGGVGVHYGPDGEVLIGDGDVPYFPFDGACPACLDNGLCLLACNQNHPNSIGVDSTHVYWANEGDPPSPFAGGAIMQMDKSGSNVSALVPSLTTGPRDVAVRSACVYWSERYGNIRGSCGGVIKNFHAGSSGGVSFTVNDTTLF